MPLLSARTALGGISPDHYASLIEQVTPSTPMSGPLDDVVDRFARIVWTHIGAPGDTIAGALVQRLGATTALTAVVEQWPPRVMRSALAHDEETGVPDDLHALAAQLPAWRERFDVDEVFRSLRTAAELGATVLIPSDPQWPGGLEDLGAEMPHALWVRGQVDSLTRLERSLAVIGARVATAYGSAMTSEAVSGLVREGIAVVNGGGYGIEGAALQAAVGTSGSAFAVVSSGVDATYPPAHAELFETVIHTGALVTERPPYTAPTRWSFLARNRILAALSSGTVLMESSSRSAALLTAQKALQLVRPVGAVPGQVDSPSASGCLMMIRDHGARLVTGSEDMSRLLPPA
ncbi:DNA-processing protein DprA [Clavibacter nebraskensis]|uniref:DNA-processing protein DprA n=1 Tax=Clavibacter nebraskensis TaxID=31963 RepID=UPI003F4C246C